MSVASPASALVEAARPNHVGSGRPLLSAHVPVATPSGAACTARRASPGTRERSASCAARRSWACTPITARAASSALAHAVSGVNSCAARRARQCRVDPGGAPARDRGAPSVTRYAWCEIASPRDGQRVPHASSWPSASERGRPDRLDSPGCRAGRARLLRLVVAEVAPPTATSRRRPVAGRELTTKREGHLAAMPMS